MHCHTKFIVTYIQACLGFVVYGIVMFLCWSIRNQSTYRYKYKYPLRLEQLNNKICNIFQKPEILWRKIFRPSNEKFAKYFKRKSCVLLPVPRCIILFLFINFTYSGKYYRLEDYSTLHRE